MKKITINSAIMGFLALALIVCMPLMGSDCSSTNPDGTATGGDVKGTWQLNLITGNLQDVCLYETVVFPSSTSGTATLTCPGLSAISRNYTYANNQLTYTQTGLVYDVSTTTSGLLVFKSTGSGAGRTLTYTKIASDKPLQPAGNNSAGTNSSEK